MPTPSDDNRDPRPPIVALGLIVCVIVLAFLSAIVALELAGRDTGDVLYLLSAVLIPTSVTIYNAYLSSKTNSSVRRVENNVNGKMTRLMDHAGIHTRRSDHADVEAPAEEQPLEPPEQRQPATE